MKLNYPILALVSVLFYSTQIQAQNTYVPDDKFEQYLISQGYDDVMDDSVSTASINTITTLNLRQKSIVDLTGINDFVALVDLNISNNLAYNVGYLSVVDITGLVNLEKLDANYNEIASIDLSNNTKLTDLNLEHNKLSSIDLSALIELKNLKLGSNELTTFDVSNSPKLSIVEIQINQITGTLDLSNQPELYSLIANNNSLENVIFNNSCKKDLFELNLSDNKLTSIDLSDFEELFKLYLSNNELTSVEFNSNNKNIYDFTVAHNNLTTLDFDIQRGGLNLETFNCSYNELTSISISSSIGGIRSFNCDSNQLASFAIDGFRITELFISDNPGVVLSYSNSTSLERLHINNNGLTSLSNFPSTLISLWCSNNKLTSLPELGNMYDLDCSNNKLTSLPDIKNLTSLNCSYNDLDTLIISSDSRLKDLDCSNNNLTSIAELSQVLSWFSCSNNEITTINFDNIPNWQLQYLYCDSNKIDSLDLSRFSSLYSLSCAHNELTTLNLNNQSFQNSLYHLYCNDNKLTELDLRNVSLDKNSYPLNFNTTGNADLSCIYVSDKAYYSVFTAIDAHTHFVLDEEECDGFNPWVSIPDSRFENELIKQGIDDVADFRVLKANVVDLTELSLINLKIQSLIGIEAFVNLTELNFRGNYVSIVDLSKNVKLTALTCSNNLNLTTLDISHSYDLLLLDCQHTSIFELDLMYNERLKYLECNDTKITKLDLSSNPLLESFIAENCELQSLDFRNINASNMDSINTINNPDLTCIYVDDVASFENAVFAAIDPTTSFVVNEAACNSLSVESLNLNLGINIFPNPASGYFKIDARVNKVTVYNNLGRVVETFVEQSVYNTSNLVAGIYFIFIETDKGNSIKKLSIKKS